MTRDAAEPDEAGADGDVGPEQDGPIAECDGRPVIPEGGSVVTDEMVTTLRDAGRR